MKVRDYLLADVLVIGGGVAGCRAAIEATEYAASVLLVDPDRLGKSPAGLSAAPIFAAAYPHLIPADTWQQHARDSLLYGEELGDPQLAAILARDALRNAWELERYGYPWARSVDGRLDPQEAPGHHFRRILHASSEGPFETPEQALAGQVRSHVGVQVMEGVTITNLLQQQGRVVGAVGFEAETGDLYGLTAGSTVLASGGMGSLFSLTAQRGSGMGMAYRLGAELLGPELQFAPSGGPSITSLGGLRIDDGCRTTLPGLYAAGEITGGIHGRRLLPGNALAEEMVFGALAGREAVLARRPLPRIKEEGVKEEISRLQKFTKGAGRRGSLELTLDELHEKLVSVLTAAVEDPAGINAATWSEWENYGPGWFRELRRSPGALSSTDLLQWVEMDSLLELAVVVLKAAQLRLEKESSYGHTGGPAPLDPEKFNVLARRTPEGPSLTILPVQSSLSDLRLAVPTHA